MTGYETCRYEMFKRVCEFGMMHGDRFPEGATGREAFEAVAAAIAEIDDYSSAGRTAREHSWRKKAEARNALVARLRAIARTARDMAKRDPEADARFPLPTRRSDVALKHGGQLFVHECQKVKDSFVQLGMPDTFVADLKALVDAFEGSTSRSFSRRTTIVVTRVGTQAALAKGFDAVLTLDIIVTNALGHDPALVAVWKAARRMEKRDRPSGSRH